jgi:hypothetical protein
VGELERLKSRFPSDDDDDDLSRVETEISEDWLAQIAAESKNVIQFSPPQLVLAEC